MTSKIFQIIFCSVLLISCSEERVVLKEYSDDDIKLQWFYTEYLYQRGNDFIEISCQLGNIEFSTTTFNFPKDWIKKVDVKDKKIRIDHTITLDIINKIIVKDSICDYEVILNEVD